MLADPAEQAGRPAPQTPDHAIQSEAIVLISQKPASVSEPAPVKRRRAFFCPDRTCAIFAHVDPRLYQFLLFFALKTSFFDLFGHVAVVLYVCFTSN